jgi:serine/threonine protein phosphatase 1
MIKLISDDLERSPAKKTLSVLLGDYVDRGPESRFVLDILCAEIFPTAVVALRGNHETMLLSFLREPATGGLWRANGGVETLHSYGLDVAGFRRGRDFEKIAEQFRSEFPPSHLDFMREARLATTIGDYFFCHAGIRPKVPLDQQREEDLLWIREEFITSERNHGKLVVHGHTPVLEPEVRHNRINVDTGAYVSGRLTALVLEAATRRFLST